jgi:hypothetical protein
MLRLRARHRVNPLFISRVNPLVPSSIFFGSMTGQLMISEHSEESVRAIEDARFHGWDSEGASASHLTLIRASDFIRPQCPFACCARLRLSSPGHPRLRVAE